MKRVLVRITPEVLGQFCKTTNDSIVCNIKGVPEDSEFIGAYYSHEHNSFEHDSFEDIPKGNKMPFKEVKISAYRV